MDKNTGALVYFDHKGLHVGSKLYIGDDLSIEDIFGIPLRDCIIDKRYSCKVKHYPGGKWKRVRCNNRKFRVAIYGKNKEYKALPRAEQVDEYDEYEEKTPVEERRDRVDNIVRAQDRVFEIVQMNLDSFKLFVTITFDDDKVDATNAGDVMKKLRNWLSNLVQRKGLKYILVPELHKSGRIHAHMLCNNIFELVDSGTRNVEGFTKPLKISTIERYNIPDNRIKNIIYNVKNWKYGFSTALYTYGDGIGVSKYVADYITKGSKRIFGRYYWVSKNLNMYAPIELRDEDPNLFNVIPLPAHRSMWSDDEYKYDDNFRKRIE